MSLKGISVIQLMRVYIYETDLRGLWR